MLDPRLVQLYKELAEIEAREAWTEQVPIYEKSIEIALDVYGMNHDETLALFTEYGGLLRNLGRYEEALPALQKAIQIARAIKGVHHPDYASTLTNMANLLRMMNHHNDSEKLFLEAKRILEATIGKDAFVYVGLCNNLGLLYQAMGRYEESIPLHNHCLSVLRQSPEYAVLYGVTLNNLVEPYKHTGKRDLAIQVLKEAIEIFKTYIDHATTLYAAAMNNLGSIYFEDKDYEKAFDCFRLALDISLEKLGPESESYKNSKINYEMTQKMITDGKADASTSLKTEITSKITSTSYRENITQDSKGLELAEAYFYDICYPMLQRELSAYLPRIAAGLVGEGSECYGYDDMVSRDHDFGPAFQIYIPAEDIPVYGKKLREEVNKLPTAYAGFDARIDSTYGNGRIGLFSIEDFYDKFLSIHEVPTSNRIWMQLTDIPLSTATNGKVFMDNLGKFTAIREGLLKHYPKDVQLKKMTAECMQVAQSGQYNFPRSIKRGQYVAAHHALDEFITHYSSILYLLNRKYKPYYKWEQEGLKSLPVLGMEAHRLLGQIATLPIKEQSGQIIFQIETLCQKLIDVLKNRGLTSSSSDFLLDHGPELLQHIEDPQLKNSNPWI